MTNSFPSAYRERELKYVLTGKNDPTDDQWSTALEQLLNHLKLNPVPSEDETNIPLDIPEALLLRSALNAHNQGITLNQYMVNAIKALLEALALEEVEGKPNVQNP